MSDLSRAVAIARKEVRQIRRDPVLPRLIVGLPIAMLLLFGYAANFTLDHIPLAVHSPFAGGPAVAFVDELTAHGRFRVVLRAADAAAVVGAVRDRDARVGLVIVPPAPGEGAPRISVYLDGSDPNFAFQAQAALQSAAQAVGAKAGASGAARLEVHTLYNPDNHTTWFMIPGIVGLILTQVTVLLTALAIVREKESRMLESLIATPVRPIEVITGKVAPYLALAFADALVILGLGHWVFGVPIRGDLGSLGVLTFLYVLGSLGVGILISTLARTQIQAVFATMAYTLPSIFLSGFVFPIDAMPPAMRGLTYLTPLRYFLDVLRGVLLRGGGWGELAFDAGALVVFAVGMLSLATLRFRKRLAV